MKRKGEREKSYKPRKRDDKMKDLVGRVEGGSARELRREEKRRKELRRYYMASKFMRYVERVIGWFYLSDREDRRETRG